jgi:hypothetical protein
MPQEDCRCRSKVFLFLGGSNMEISWPHKLALFFTTGSDSANVNQSSSIWKRIIWKAEIVSTIPYNPRMLAMKETKSEYSLIDAYNHRKSRPCDSITRY